MIFLFIFAHSYFPGSGQAVVSGVVPSPRRYVPSVFIAHTVQRSHCSSIFIEIRMLLTHAFALSESLFVRKKTSLRIIMSMHSGGLELTQLTYSGHEDNVLHHRGDGHHHAHRSDYGMHKQ